MDLSWVMQAFSRDSKPSPSSGARDVDLPGVGRLRVVRSISCINENCPRPQLLTIRALSLVAESEVVELICDNPAAVESVPSLMLVIDCTHIASIRETDCWRVFMRKGISQRDRDYGGKRVAGMPRN